MPEHSANASATSGLEVYPPPSCSQYIIYYTATTIQKRLRQKSDNSTHHSALKRFDTTTARDTALNITASSTLSVFDSLPRIPAFNAGITTK